MKRNKTGAAVVQMFQSGPEDNGQTALAMVLTSLGQPVSPWELEAVDSAADLVDTARAHGLYAEGCRMTARELCAAPLPAIAHWRFRSFVVVSRVRRGRVWINDPEEGIRVLSRREFEAGFTGVAVCFAGQAGMERGEKPPRARDFFARFPAVSLLMGTAQAFISVCCGAAVMALRLSAGSVSGAGSRPAALFSMSMLLLLGTALFQRLLARRCGEELRRQASRICARGLERKSPLFFRQVQGHQAAYACEGCGMVGAAGGGLGLYTMELWTAAVCLALVAVQDPWAGLAAALPAAVFAASVKGQEELLCDGTKRAGRDRFVLTHQAARQLDRLDGLRGARRRFERWLYAAGGQPAPGAADRLGWYWRVFAAVELAAVFGACLLRTAAGRLGLEGLAGCVGAALFFTGAMGALPRRAGAMAVLRAVQESFESLFREGPARLSVPPPAPPVEDAEELAVQNIDLPPTREGGAGFRNVSLSVRRGEVLSVAVDGGRLALSRIIAGIAPPAQGAVYVGGADVRVLREEELYRRVTLLGRGIPLLHGTVRENIAAGCGGISDFAVAQAASDALLHERVLLREKGYDTPAASLSAGERVLLEFACAFARGTPFLVADACTDRLDPGTAQALLDAARSRGVGTVLVTERGRPFRWADAVCRIEEGRVTLRERTEMVDWEGQKRVQSK